jgi:hypothetical protein
VEGAETLRTQSSDKTIATLYSTLSRQRVVYTRAIRKVTTVNFTQLMQERVENSRMRGLLPCKPSHNWSPNVCSCLQSALRRVQRSKFPQAAKIRAVVRFLHTRNITAEDINYLRVRSLWPNYNE